MNNHSLKDRNDSHRTEYFGQPQAELLGLLVCLYIISCKDTAHKHILKSLRYIG